MLLKRFGRVAMTLVAVAAIGSTARADEIVHFTNGAEMAVRSHVVETDMLKLDLGGNNFISFPIAMVDKIVNAGQDVFLNAVYHPSNQAVPGGASSALVSNPGTAGPAPVGLSRLPSPGRNGARLGEAADGIAANDAYGASAAATADPKNRGEFSTPSRPRFDPLRPLPPGGVATIDPPGGRQQIPRRPQRMAPRTTVEPPAQPAAPSGGQESPPAADPGAPTQDVGGSETANPDDSAQQDPPPNP